MARTQSFTGRQGNMTLNSNVVPITKWNAKLTRNYADATDSSTYDPVTGQVWETNAPGTVFFEGTIEGNFDLATTSADIIALFKTDGPYPCVLGLTRSVNFSSGNVVLKDADITIEVPGATMCTFSCSFKSDGIQTLF